MPTVTDPNIKAKPPLWKLLLTLLYNGLGIAHNAGLFEKANGMPKLLVSPATPRAPEPLLGGIKDKFKEKVAKIGLDNIQARIDTEEERKTIVEGLHIPGLPARLTWIVSALGGLLMAVLGAAAHVPTEILVHEGVREWATHVFYAVNWIELWQGVSAFVLTKIAFVTQQDSHRGTAVVPTKNVAGIVEVEELPQ